MTQFSDTTNKNGIIQECERWTKLGDAGISGNATRLKEFTSRINNWARKIVTMIFDSQDEWDVDDSNNTDYPISTTNLVANQQDYTFPISMTMYKIKRVEVSYDGSNWYKSEPIDINEMGLATDTTSIANRFLTTQPYYDISANAFFLYPIPTSNVTAGLKIWFQRDINPFVSTDTTKEPGFDRPFHEMLGLGASMDYAIENQLPVKEDLKAKISEYEARLRAYYGRKDEDRRYTLKSAFIDYN